MEFERARPERAEEVGVHRVGPAAVIDGLHRRVEGLGDDHPAEDAVAEPVGRDRVEATVVVARCGNGLDEFVYRPGFDRWSLRDLFGHPTPRCGV